MNEVLRLEEGALLLMAPCCKSFSVMQLGGYLMRYVLVGNEFESTTNRKNQKTSFKYSFRFLSRTRVYESGAGIRPGVPFYSHMETRDMAS